VMRNPRSRMYNRRKADDASPLAEAAILKAVKDAASRRLMWASDDRFPSMALAMIHADILEKLRADLIREDPPEGWVYCVAATTPDLPDGWYCRRLRYEDKRVVMLLSVVDADLHGRMLAALREGGPVALAELFAALDRAVPDEEDSE